MGNIELEKLRTPPPDGISYPFPQNAPLPAQFQPQAEAERCILIKIELLKEYFLPFDPEHGHLLNLISYAEAPSGPQYQEPEKISACKIFVGGEFSANSYTVCLPENSNAAQSNAIMRYYIDDFMERLFYGREKTLLFQNNQTLRDRFRLAGLRVNKPPVIPTPSSGTDQPAAPHKRVKARNGAATPEQRISYDVIIADNNSSIPHAPGSFHAALFPLTLDFDEQGLDVTVLAKEGQSVVLSKEGKIIERGTDAVDPQAHIAILEHYFAPLAARPYFYYKSHVETKGLH